MSNRRTSVRFPVFNNYVLHVLFARSVAATGKRLKEDLTDAEAAFVSKENRPGVGWLVFGQHPTPDVVVHEAYHAITHLLTHVGVGRDEETFAYHLDFLVGRIHKFLSKKREIA